MVYWLERFFFYWQYMGGKTKRAMLRLAGLIGMVGVSDSYVVSD